MLIDYSTASSPARACLPEDAQATGLEWAPWNSTQPREEARPGQGPGQRKATALGGAQGPGERTGQLRPVQSEKSRWDGVSPPVPCAGDAWEEREHVDF